MRKLTYLSIGLIVSIVLFTGMTKVYAGTAKSKEHLHILASFLPIYIFTNNLIQGVPEVSVELLVPPGTGCPHGYSLTPNDLKKIASSSVLVVNGLGIEEFMGRPLQAANPDIKIINASEGITPLETRGHDTHHDHDHHYFSQVNSHVWMSPALAINQVKNIADSLAAIDPEHSELYRKNATNFIARLEKLISEVENTANMLEKRRVVVFHEAFDYLARDLDLTIVAYIQEDPGQYPSARKLHSLIRTVKQEKAAAIFAETQYPLRIVQLLSHETGVPFYVLDTITSARGTVGIDYYEKAMRKNLAITQKALGEKLSNGRNSY